MKKVLKAKITRRKRSAHWRPFGYDVRECWLDKDLFQPFGNVSEAEYWYSGNCSGCAREFPEFGPGSCDLAAAISIGYLTQSQLARIGGVTYDVYKCSCCKKKFKVPSLSDCKERPNPVLPVK
jgi:hypothetical protein